VNAMKSAFLPFDERLEIIEQVIKPGYDRLRRSVVAGGASVTAAGTT
jgi:hypothetical protein